MQRSLIIGIWIWLLGLGGSHWTQGLSQGSYLNRPELLEKVGHGLQNTYNFAFYEARATQKELLRATPDHPAPFFLEALIIYWENFPLVPDNPNSHHFVDLMDKCVDLSARLLEQESTYQEGVFFELFGKAFKAMYWADNGKAGKVVPDLRSMYRRTKEGFALKDQFLEFYFSTGLYNYYIEAYPEAHPAYKSLLAFMQKGDKALGLEQLNYAIHHAVFLKVEATLFMSLIQLKYEQDLNTAAIYARSLYRDHPENTYYQGHLLTILLHQHRQAEVNKVLQAMDKQKDSWTDMIRTLASAFAAEKEETEAAIQAYQKLLQQATAHGPIADIYVAMAYMGLSRIHKQKEQDQEARRYARKASKYTTYPFILDERVNAPR